MASLDFVERLVRLVMDTRARYHRQRRRRRRDDSPQVWPLVYNAPSELPEDANGQQRPVPESPRRSADHPSRLADAVQAFHDARRHTPTPLGHAGPSSVRPRR